MADSQALVISYGGFDVAMKIVDGQLEVTVPLPDPEGPQKALDPKIFQLFGKLLPIILMLFSGGFSPAVLTALLPIIADLFGVSLSQASSMISTQAGLEGQP